MSLDRWQCKCLYCIYYVPAQGINDFWNLFNWQPLQRYVLYSKLCWCASIINTGWCWLGKVASGHKSGTSIGRLKCSLGIVGCFFFFFSSCHVYYKRAGRSKIIAMNPTMAQPMPVVAAYGGFFHCHGPSSHLACLLRATQEQSSHLYMVAHTGRRKSF